MKHTYCKVFSNTVLIDGRPIIPGGLRSQMLSALHRSHVGVKGMKARARVASDYNPYSNRLAEGTVQAEDVQGQHGDTGHT